MITDTASFVRREDESSADKPAAAAEASGKAHHMDVAPEIIAEKATVADRVSRKGASRTREAGQEPQACQEQLAQGRAQPEKKARRRQA